MIDDVKQQLVVGMIVSWTLERIKDWKAIPGIDHYTDTLNRVISVLIALFTSAGFTLAWSGTAIDGGVLTMHVPAASAVVNFLVNAVFSFGAQQAAYQGLVKKSIKPTP